MNAALTLLWTGLGKWSLLLIFGWAAHGMLRNRDARWMLILWRSIFGFGLIAPILGFLPISTLRIHIPGLSLAATSHNFGLQPAKIANPTTVSLSNPIAGIVIAPAVSSVPPGIPFIPVISWEAILLAIWICGFVWEALRLIRFQLALGRLRALARPANFAIQARASEIGARLNLRYPIPIRVSDSTSSPFVCGLFRPTILLPAHLVQTMTEEELSTLLSHEIAHLRQRDLPWCVGWRWMKAAYWFHPLVWGIPSAHKLACEHEADRMASEQFTDPKRYPQVLAGLTLRVLALPKVETHLALNGSAEIARRLRHIGREGIGPWRRKHTLAGVALAGVLMTTAACTELSQTRTTASNDSNPLMLDLGTAVRLFSASPAPGDAFSEITGQTTFDGLPFNIEGRIDFFGSARAGGRPELKGVRIGRRFDELHLLHYAQYAADPDGTCVARIRLNYEDGSTYEYPIIFGNQLRLWVWTPLERDERLGDPGSRVIWQSKDVAQGNMAFRMFESTIHNPYPARMVTSMDVFSAGNRPSYQLVAATVARSDLNRMATPPVAAVPVATGYQNGVLTLQVLDSTGGKAISGALVTASLYKGGSTQIALVTDSNGAATVHYPVGNAELWISVAKEGHSRETKVWESSEVPAAYVFRLTSGSTIGGVVVGSNGRPKLKATLHFDGYKSDGTWVQDISAQCGAGGRWSISGISPRVSYFSIRVIHTGAPGMTFWSDTAPPILIAGEQITEASFRSGEAVLKISAEN